MLTVKDNWQDVKVGDRVRITRNAGYNSFEATVVFKGSQNLNGHVEFAEFNDNVTLKIDGTPRKKSAKERREQFISSYAIFEIVHVGTQISIPKTAGELTDAHIGMRFRFHGAPAIEGTYAGKLTANVLYVADATDSDAEFWAKEGYYIGDGDKLIYIGGGAPKDVDETVDTDAKLAAYFNQELDKFYKVSSGAHDRTMYREKSYGEAILEIIKTLTK